MTDQNVSFLEEFGKSLFLGVARTFLLVTRTGELLGVRLLLGRARLSLSSDSMLSAL